MTHNSIGFVKNITSLLQTEFRNLFYNWAFVHAALVINLPDYFSECWASLHMNCEFTPRNQNRNENFKLNSENFKTLLKAFVLTGRRLLLKNYKNIYAEGGRRRIHSKSTEVFFFDIFMFLLCTYAQAYKKRDKKASRKIIMGVYNENSSRLMINN